MTDVYSYLNALVERGGSDLFFSVGAPVNLKRDGELEPFDDVVLTNEQVRELAYQVMNAKQVEQFENTLEMNLGLGVPAIGRFRINVFFQRGEVAMVIRHISNHIPAIADLGLPEKLKELVMQDRGLILVVGNAGSGKSTTLASMIDYRNSNRSGHIICIEDPVEFIHQHKRSLVNQREVGLDTVSFEEALRNVLRESPDVIVIGEIRDRQTMQHALHYSETGHLVLATLHATSTVQAIERVVNLFPEDNRQQILGDISMNLAAIIGQRLLRGSRRKLLPAVELLLRTPFIVDLIERDELPQIKIAMSRSTEQGLQTFDQDLNRLRASGEISLDEALRNADSRTDMMLKSRLEDGQGHGDHPDFRVMGDDDN